MLVNPYSSMLTKQASDCDEQAIFVGGIFGRKMGVKAVDDGPRPSHKKFVSDWLRELIAVAQEQSRNRHANQQITP